MSEIVRKHPTSNCIKDKTGQTFGRLTVMHLDRVELVSNKRQAFWECYCLCGNTKIVSSNHLKSGATKTCGDCAWTMPEEEYYQTIVKERLMKKIHISESHCWEWSTPFNTYGYGLIHIKRKQLMAHIVAYRIYKGSTNGLCVLHKCDNPPCCNPDHLFLGTKKDNTQDMMRKGRGLVGEKNGQSKLTNLQAQEIRELAKTKQYTQKQIGLMFGITASTVNAIFNERSRKSIIRIAVGDDMN